MSPEYYYIGGVRYDARLGIKPPVQPAPPPAKSSLEMYPERYIFLMVAIVLFIRFVGILRRHRQWQLRQDRILNAEYERLEAGINGVEDEATIRLPIVNTTRILLPSEIAQLSQRPMDDPYYMASLSQHADGPPSQLPQYEHIIQAGDSEPQTKSEAPEVQLVALDLPEDQPPTYVDATTRNPSG